MILNLKKKRKRASLHAQSACNESCLLCSFIKSLSYRFLKKRKYYELCQTTSSTLIQLIERDNTKTSIKTFNIKHWDNTYSKNLSPIAYRFWSNYVKLIFFIFFGLITHLVLNIYPYFKMVVNASNILF